MPWGSAGCWPSRRGGEEERFGWEHSASYPMRDGARGSHLGEASCAPLCPTCRLGFDMWEEGWHEVALISSCSPQGASPPQSARLPWETLWGPPAGWPGAALLAGPWQPPFACGPCSGTHFYLVLLLLRGHSWQGSLVTKSSQQTRG